MASQRAICGRLGTTYLPGWFGSARLDSAAERLAVAPAAGSRRNTVTEGVDFNNTAVHTYDRTERGTDRHTNYIRRDTLASQTQRDTGMTPSSRVLSF